MLTANEDPLDVKKARARGLGICEVIQVWSVGESVWTTTMEIEKGAFVDLIQVVRTQQVSGLLKTNLVGDYRPAV
jgi:hypothetical protein